MSVHTKKYLSLGETLRRFVRSLPGFVVLMVLVGVVGGVVTQDWEIAAWSAFATIGLAPVWWLRWEGISQNPMANPKALPLAFGWFGVWVALMFLLDRVGVIG